MSPQEAEDRARALWRAHDELEAALADDALWEQIKARVPATHAHMLKWDSGLMSRAELLLVIVQRSQS